MTTWWGYILITELPPGWTNEQRLVIHGSMGTRGKQNGPYPHEINHSRVALTGLEMFYEALFDKAEITREAVVVTIAAALGLPEAAVDAKIEYEIAGGEGCTWAESNAAIKAYMQATPEDWEPEA